MKRFAAFFLFSLNFIYPQIIETNLKEHVFFLASPELKGRLTGSPEEMIAANYIKNKFQEYGLKPLFGNEYFQNFEFIFGTEASENCKLKINSKHIELGKEYTILGFSDNIEVTGDVIFAGYGLVYEKFKIDDYRNINVKDKIVIAFRGLPKTDSSNFEFERLGGIREKAKIAIEKGAKALIIINPPSQFPEDNLIPTRYDRSGFLENFAVINVKREIIDSFLKNKVSFEEIEKDYNQKSDKYKDLFSFNIELKTELKKIKRTGTNVAGYLEAPGSSEFVIIGAHYDHLGMGDFGSLYKGTEKLVHPGADDNASGTAMTIELARAFSEKKSELNKSIVFVAFSGEELGLLGSSFLANNFPLDLRNCVAMINMDMIGRMNEDNELIIYGAATAKQWKDFINNANQRNNFKLSLVDDGFGPSDHSSFYAKQIPVLNFFTGSHQDYHRPTDTPEKLKYDKFSLTGNFIYDIVNQIILFKSKFDFVNVPRRDQGGRMTLRTYIGVMPDFSENAIGFKIMGVTEGSPAQKAGLKAGDIIIKFGDYRIRNIYDYMSALNKYSPGDKIKFLIQRNDDKLELEVELAGR